MKYVYDLLYLLILIVGSPWLCWRILFQGKNRKGWRQKLFGLVPDRPDDSPCIWIHAVSVGEVNLLPNLVRRLKEENIDHWIAISTTTETGLQLANTLFPEDLVFFCPADFSWAVNNTLDRIRPDMLVLAELEIWPNLISITADRGIPVVLINGRISSKSFKGYHRIRFLIGPILSRLSKALVQTNQYRNRLMQLKIPGNKIDVTGNIKFDNAFACSTDSGALREIIRLSNYNDNDSVFVAGSTLEVEDLLLIEIFSRLHLTHSNLKLILVPRHPERVPRVEQVLRQKQLSYVLRSNLDTKQTRQNQTEVLIVDVIGELGLWWKIADAGFVGGSMGNRGGQNMIEPAACAVPIAFGPDTKNFKDVVRLLLADRAATVIEDEVELEAFMDWSITNPDDAKAMGRRGRNVVHGQQGALVRTAFHLREILCQRSSRSGEPDSRSAA